MRRRGRKVRRRRARKERRREKRERRRGRREKREARTRKGRRLLWTENLRLPKLVQVKLRFADSVRYLPDPILWD